MQTDSDKQKSGDDLAELRAQTARFQKGEISETEFRALRVPHGCYEERRSGAFMVRARLPGGALLISQMRALAAVARRWGSGRLHLTTRQDLQVHDLPLSDVCSALEELRSAGLSTRGGGGNTVRNITACPRAGICPDEVLDVSDLAEALTDIFALDPSSYRLPRKLKLALSGCSADCSGAMMNDLGFVARIAGDQRGFAVYAGGGMGTGSRTGELLQEFAPRAELHLAVEAVKRIFDAHGNRRNRNRARLRHLIEERGFGWFKQLYDEQLLELRRDGWGGRLAGGISSTKSVLEARESQVDGGRIPEPQVAGEDGVGARADLRSADEATSASFLDWRRANVSLQKQRGFYSVEIPVPVGDILAAELTSLADALEFLRRASLRVTQTQNLTLCWVADDELLSLHRALSEIGLATTQSLLTRDLVVCTGASTCKLGIGLSRNLASAVCEALESSGPDLGEAVGLGLHINGCPNACGRHLLASIGLAGAARRVDGRLVPHYQVYLGGRRGEGRARLATGGEAVPARSIPAFLVDLLWAFRQSGEYPDFDSYLDSGGREEVSRLAAPHKRVPAFEEASEYYRDWGSDELFSLAGRGPGECSAGVFDLIAVDLATARDSLKDGRLQVAIEAASRALLVTRGEDAREGPEALRLFEIHFLDGGLIDPAFRPLIAAAQGAQGGFDPPVEQVEALVDAVARLHSEMDESLRLRSESGSVESRKPAPVNSPALVDREADLRGVTCPLNYVKTRMLLERMKPGQVLAVTLDESGGRNVPKSAKKDGHQVLSTRREGTSWVVSIRRS